MTLQEEINWCKSQKKISPASKVALDSILKRLQGLQRTKEPPPPEYSNCIDLYNEFMKSRGVPMVMDARQGKALKEIIAKLKAVSLSKNENAAYESLKFIFAHWNRTGNYIGGKIKLTDINANLQEILDKIRNGATKQQSNINKAEQYLNNLTKGT